jgi:ligand-binding SRPBCC domain-containing protein
MRFVAESVIRCTPERLFAFHELPDALQRLTPPWEHARIVQSVASLERGNVAIVAIRIAPLLWTRIESMHTIYDPPHKFEDVQVRGPFRSWRHQHLIEPHPDGARLSDIIDVEPPLGILGRWFGPLIIRPRLQRAFKFRHEVTQQWCEAGCEA